MAGKVNIIKANPSSVSRNRGKTVERKRVAAYCRVSTDNEEQINSYHSQVRYYTDLINQNPEWTMAGVYADEAITGTQVSKRNGFQKMIYACLNGQVDMVITKSISRFARNTLDTLKYVRMLKEKNIPVLFEDEKINTLSMDGELLLVVLSSVAQQEVENISANVKKGLEIKMSRGEIVGFVSALGYDYDTKTKQISVNKEEAKIVKYIFQRYLEGAGCTMISKELMKKGIKSPKGSSAWYEATILDILKNEKYVGDLVQGKTYTVDPISQRRLTNLGEVNKYYIQDHHEAIISRDVFDQAQIIMKQRSKSKYKPEGKPNEYRTAYTRKYAFSCMCRCGYCGTTLTRRHWHSGNNYQKMVWFCIRSCKYGKTFCPNSKSIEEKALESAFVESYRILTKDRSDVLQEFLERTERSLRGQRSEREAEAKSKANELSHVQTKLDNLLDLYLEKKIDDDAYVNKKKDLEDQSSCLKRQLEAINDVEDTKKDLENRINSMREMLENGNTMNDFDRQVFESIVDYVIVGGYDDDGNADPYKITFVYKTGTKHIQDIRKFKPKRKNAAQNELQSMSKNEVNELQSNTSCDTRGNHCVAITHQLVEIAEFKHFF